MNMRGTNFLSQLSSALLSLHNFYSIHIGFHGRRESRSGGTQDCPDY